MAQKTLSTQLNNEESNLLEKILVKKGWSEDRINNEYVALRMKNDNGSVCTLYTSKKVVFQGNENFEDIVELVKEDDYVVNMESHIGVDEVGKGDYFGPLVVVACFVDNNFLKKITNIGVGDSKKFSDNSIRKMYDQLKEYEYFYSSVVEPSEYNELYSKLKNVSLLLAKQHSKVIEMGLKDLKEKGMECKKVVIDQFSSKKSRVVDELGPLAKSIEFEQFHKGESDIAVATASVLARGIFLEEMEIMKDKYYFNFPKGASNVISQAKEFVNKHGVSELEKVAKISFKTTKSVLQTTF